MIHIDLNDIDEKKIGALSELKKNELIDLIAKYLKNKNNVFHTCIVDLYVRKPELKKSYFSNYLSDNIGDDWYKQELEKLQSGLNNTNKKIRSCHTINERKKLETAHECQTDEIEFLNDLSKLQKILQGHGISITKRGIIEICFSMIQLSKFQYFSKLLEPYLPTWKKKLGDTHSLTQVLEEVTNTDFDFFSADENAVLSKWGYLWVLKQFGYDYRIDNIWDELKPILEKRELVRFEKSLNKPKKKTELNLTDFSKFNGIEFEHFMADIFKRFGYIVEMTQITGDKGADLILKKREDIIAVQLKKYTRPVSIKAVQEVVAAKKYYSANKGMVITSSYFTPSAIELAIVNDVILWDNDKLKQILSRGHCEI